LINFSTSEENVADLQQEEAGEFILSVPAGSPGFQAILMQRELSLLPFFCGKRKVGKSTGHGAQKNGLCVRLHKKEAAF